MMTRRDLFQSASFFPFQAATNGVVQVANRTWSDLRGFNYQPSYGSTGLEIWQKFDGAAIDHELAIGKKHFPRISAIRLWLCWHAFNRSPQKFAYKFEAALSIAHKHGLKVMPVLFNRWHDPVNDWGGIYTDHFLTGADNLLRKATFEPYLETVVGAHATDERIFAWDLANEPFHCSPDFPEALKDASVKAEYAWLEGLYRTCKRLGAKAPVTVGIHQGAGGIEQIEPISDFLSIHPYYFPKGDKQKYEEMLDRHVAFANAKKKALLASETCWGSLDNAVRSEVVRYTLSQLKQRGIGWLAYLLHHSLIADAHWPEYGHVHPGVGTLHFIEPNGSIRPGHEVFNEY